MYAWNTPGCEERAGIGDFTWIRTCTPYLGSWHLDFEENDGFTSGDINGDGKAEIVHADRSDRVRIFDIKGTKLADWPLEFEERDGFIAGDVNGDKKAEIIQADRDDKVRVFSVNGDKLAEWNLDFKEYDGFASGDVNGDGKAEIILGDRDDRVRIFSMNGDKLADWKLDFEERDGFTTGDVNGDGKAEIIHADRADKVRVFSMNGDKLTEWNEDFEEWDGFTTGDVNGDGKAEIIHADRADSVRITNIDGGRVAEWKLDFEERDGFTAGDVNGDGKAEIIHADRDDQGRVIDINGTRLAIEFEPKAHIFTIQHAIRYFRETGKPNWADYLENGENFQDIAAGSTFQDYRKGRAVLFAEPCLLVFFKLGRIKLMDLGPYGAYTHYYDPVNNHGLIMHWGRALDVFFRALNVGLMCYTYGILACNMVTEPSNIVWDTFQAANVGAEEHYQAASALLSRNDKKGGLFEAGQSLHLLQDTCFYPHDDFEGSDPLGKFMAHSDIEDLGDGHGNPADCPECHITAANTPLTSLPDYRKSVRDLSHEAAMETIQDNYPARTPGGLFDKHDVMPAIRIELNRTERYTVAFFTKLLTDMNIPPGTPENPQTASKRLKVTAPTSEQTWQAGTTHTITWTQAGLSGSNVRIELKDKINPFVLIRTITSSTPASAGSLPWIVPVDVPAGTTYSIHVTSLNDPSVSSYGWLSITAAPLSRTLKVTSPTSEQTWQAGTTHTISWTQTGLSGTNVRIELKDKDNPFVLVRTVTTSAPASAGSFTWMVPGDIPAGNTYSVHVTSLSDPSVSSYGWLSITAAPLSRTLKVTAPTSEQTWQAGTTHTITWTQAGLSGSNVRIELKDKINPFVLVRTVTTSAPASAGSYSWSVPDDIPAGTTYSIHVTSLSDPTVLSYGWLTISGVAIHTVTGITPGTAAPGTTLQAVITGTNFKPEAEAAIQYEPTNTWYQATNENYISNSELRGSIAIPSDAATGQYHVYVKNPVTGWVYLRNGFTVIPGTPSVTGISPSSVKRGTQFTATVSGTNFASGAEVKIESLGYEVPATGEQTLNPNQIRCSLTVPNDGLTGYYNVYVRNPGGAWVYGRNALQVTGGATHIVTGISPNIANMGTTFDATVYGSNLPPEAEVALQYESTNSWYQATNEQYISKNEIRCRLTIPPNAAYGKYHVYVRNPVTGWVYLRDGFLVVNVV